MVIDLLRSEDHNLTNNFIVMLIIRKMMTFLVSRSKASDEGG